jgi:hypothetical protein
MPDEPFLPMVADMANPNHHEGHEEHEGRPCQPPVDGFEDSHGECAFQQPFSE